MAQSPGFYTTKLGEFEAIALHDGVVIFDRPPGVVRNASDDEVGEAFAAAGMARDKLTITFTALAVRTGQGVVLVDTGMGDAGPPGTGGLVPNLAAAGIQPGDVTAIIISHFHGDHIGGVRRKDGTLTFPNAKIFVPAVEWDYFMDDANAETAPATLKDTFASVRRIFGPSANDITRYPWGGEILPGFTSVQANGHTPGMSAVEISSGDSKLLFVADITNNPLIFARNPTWQLAFDLDPEQATATRRNILDRAAAEKLPLFYFHAPFPALGTVVKSGDGYEYLPALWT
jgi:glyoxylase-like metal-dependent hydrolase (beta-lactamase superfamily II)